MTFKNFDDDEELYKDLKEYMMNNYDVYISRYIYDLDDDIIITT
jgi:hypothetical protein